MERDIFRRAGAHHQQQADFFWGIQTSNRTASIMKTRTKTLAFLRISLCAAALAVSGAAMAGPKDERAPNVVLIVVDDLGYADLSCVGGSRDVHTPNIDKLAESGLRFPRCYLTAPICNASRIAIITGCYQQRQNQFWYNGPGLQDPAFPTLSERLKTQGYATGYIGKYHHGDNDAPDKRGFPMNHGFDVFFGFSGGTKHYLEHKKTNPRDFLGSNGPMWVGRERKDVEGFSTELFGEQARRFIANHQDQPFYLHLSFNAVHNFTHQLPPEYLEERALRGYPDHDPATEPFNKWRLGINHPAHPEGRAWYLGQLHFLDLEIGRVMNELGERKLLEHTVIFFVSDNGGSLVTYARNTPLRGGKYTLDEGGIRTHMIVSWPERFRIGIHDETVSAMDIFPTVCALADAPLPDFVDGRSLLPALTGEGSVGHDPLFWDTGKQSAALHGRWKLVITKETPNAFLQQTETPQGEFLYDLDADIGETHDLAAEYPEVLNDLRNRLTDWRKRITSESGNLR
jgi:arylsulfatase B